MTYTVKQSFRRNVYRSLRADRQDYLRQIDTLSAKIVEIDQACHDLISAGVRQDGMAVEDFDDLG